MDAPCRSPRDSQAPGGSAVMEFFLVLLQKGVLGQRSWSYRNQLRVVVATWVERIYIDAVGSCGRVGRLRKILDPHDPRPKSRGIKSLRSSDGPSIIRAFIALAVWKRVSVFSIAFTEGCRDNGYCLSMKGL
jgi:hypothetical protein